MVKNTNTQNQSILSLSEGSRLVVIGIRMHINLYWPLLLHFKIFRWQVKQMPWSKHNNFCAWFWHRCSCPGCDSASSRRLNWKPISHCNPCNFIQVVTAVRAISPGLSVGYILMKETMQARAAGMNKPLRILVRLTLPVWLICFAFLIDTATTSQELVLFSTWSAIAGVHHEMEESSLRAILHRNGFLMYSWTVMNERNCTEILMLE